MSSKQPLKWHMESLKNMESYHARLEQQKLDLEAQLARIASDIFFCTIKL